MRGVSLRRIVGQRVESMHARKVSTNIDLILEIDITLGKKMLYREKKVGLCPRSGSKSSSHQIIVSQETLQKKNI